MMMRDGRGVLRGRCKDCWCDRYGSSSGFRCDKCGHPPGRHEHTERSGKVNDPGSEAKRDHTTLDMTALPICSREGCSRAKHRDQYGLFDYCHPSCRNECLSETTATIDKDINQLERLLRSQMSTRKPQPLETVDTLSKTAEKPQPVNTRSITAGKPQPTETVNTLSKTAEKPQPTETVNTNSITAGTPQPTEIVNTLSTTAPVDALPAPESIASSLSTTTLSSARPAEPVKQKTVNVKIKKNVEENFASGLLFFDDDYCYGAEKATRLLISGVKVESPSYQYFQSDQLRLLDILVEVESQPISQPSDLTRGTQSCVVSLILNRSVGVPPMSKVLSKAKNLPCTHVFAVKVSASEEIGIDLQSKDNEVYISRVGLLARKAGLQVGDLIVTCAKVDKEFSLPTLQESGSGEEKITQLCKCFNEANQRIILFVRRLS